MALVPREPYPHAPLAGPLGANAVRFVIEGEAASKANSRQLAHHEGRVRFVKSSAALIFECNAALQIPASARVMFPGPVRVSLWLYYRNNRRDLDESVVLDVLQARYSVGGKKRGQLVRRGVYENDRQVREKHVYHGVDAKRPRVEVLVEALP